MLRESYLYDRTTIAEIQRAAREGLYDIRGFGAKRRLPHFDDLLLLGASISRYPLEGYRERCGTDVVLGGRHAKHPLHLDTPVTIAGMSFGALSGPAKEALGRGASEDTMVAIVSLGAPRALLLRPRGGGSTLRHEFGHGDLATMGGSCQRTWEHAIPKTTRGAGPRISVQFRPRGVR